MINTLNVAQSGLSVSKVQVEGVMNNLANENTPGYKRRVVDTAELDHIDLRKTGRGAFVQGVTRITNVYMYQNLVEEQSKLASYGKLDVMLEDIESIFHETDQSGMSADLQRYFESMENLRTNPVNLIYREDVKNNADVMVNNLKTLYSNIEDLEKRTLSEAKDTVIEINSILNSIGDLSREILESTQPQNDLLDRRDALEQELAKYIDIEVSREDTYELKIGGKTAVRFDTNVHTLNLVENYTPQKDVYTKPNTYDESNLINPATWGAGDSITYTLNNEVSVTLNHGDVILDSSGNPVDLNNDGDNTNDAVDANNIINALVYKINHQKEMLGKITAYNGDYQINEKGDKVLASDSEHSEYDAADPFKDRYLVIEATQGGETNSFVGEITIDDANAGYTYDDDDNSATAEVATNRATVEKSTLLSKEGLDDIHLEIFDDKVNLEAGKLKPLIDNIQTESGANKFTEYKKLLDDFARTLSDISSSYIEKDNDVYVYGTDAVNIDVDYANRVDIELFTGADVKSLKFNEDMVNSLTQEKLDYLSSIQWKTDIDFTEDGLNKTSFSKFFQSIRYNIADDRETVRFNKESQGAVTEALNNSYDKLTKVDKDNEMVDLIKFQAAYEANAKMITVVDEMLQTILGMKR